MRFTLMSTLNIRNRLDAGFNSPFTLNKIIINYLTQYNI